MRGLAALCLGLIAAACDASLEGSRPGIGPGVEATAGAGDGDDAGAGGLTADGGAAAAPAGEVGLAPSEAGVPSPPPGAAIDSVIPADRRIAWAPGVPGGIPDYPAGVSVKSHGAAGNGTTDDTAAFKAAIAAAAPGTAVIVPAGSYRLTSTVSIGKTVALRGAGWSKTTLRCDHSASCVAIHGAGYSGSWIPVTSGHQRGATSITLASGGSGFSAGDVVELRQDNDPAVFTPGYQGDQSWGAAAVGQLLKVTGVAGNVLKLDRPLYYAYSAAMKPRVARKNVVARAGVEQLRIDRVAKSGSSMNVSFDHASECWMRGVWLERALRTHAFVSRSLRCEVSGSVFNDTWLSAGGGQGYGAELGDRATDCLVENNTFVHLRHSLVVVRGAAGNVFGYNYSRDPFASDYPNSLFPDICVHGFYPYLNLFEGNVVQWIQVDNVWGTNGATTFFRNRVEKPRPTVGAVTLKENNRYHSAVGNELGHAGSTGVVYSIDASVKATSILHGNRNHVTGAVDWDPGIAQHALPPSLYRAARPAFLAALPWPPFGPDVAAGGNALLPAEQRYRDEIQ